MGILVLLMWNIIIQLGGIQYEITEEDARKYDRITRSKEWAWFSWGNNLPLKETVGGLMPAHVRLSRSLRETTTSSTCQPIEVALLVSGQKETRAVSQLIMTILAQRSTPLILHIISDKKTGQVLKVLFDTWELPAVDVNYYVDEDMREMEDGDKARTNILLNLHKIVNQDARIIVMTPQMRLTTDIKLIFEEFSKFTPHEIIGLRTFYKRNSINLLVKQFTMDLILVNTKRLEGSVIVKNVGTLIKTSDDLSSVLARNGLIVHPLACSFNLRLEPDSEIENCLVEDIVPKALWWGPLAKHTYISSRLELIKERVEEMVTSEGELFRLADLPCLHESNMAAKSQPAEPTDTCAEFRVAASLKRRTHIDFIGHRLPPSLSSYDVTLVTQLTMDRWGVLEKILLNYKGPISIVLYARDAEAHSLEDKIAVSPAFGNRTNVVIHVVYKRPRHMAINYLRNLGIQAVQTPFTLMMDVDLVPSPNMYPYLKEMLQKERNNNSVALVIPALESFVPLPNFPGIKASVLKLWKEKKVNGFGMIRKWNLGHKPTNYEKWKTAKKPYFVEYQRAFEPYVVLPTKTMPRYDERFLDRMADKIIYAQEVFAQGYQFKILSDCYVIHLPHAVSQSRIHWETSKRYKKCGFTFMKEVKKELQQRFPGKKIPFT